MTNLLNVRQVADLLGITPVRVQQLCAKGRIKAHKHGGRDWLIAEKDVPAPGSWRQTPGRKRGK